MVAAALQAIAETPPRTYLDLQQHRTDSGATQSGDRQSVLKRLYDQCAAVGLVPALAADDIGRLHAIFDVALEHGLGSLIYDYVEEVCCDRLLTSSDPVEAFLLDGECVRRWCHKTLSVCRGRLSAWLSSGLRSHSGPTTVQREAGKLRMLLNIVEALALPDALQEHQKQHHHQRQQPVVPQTARRGAPPTTADAATESEVEEARRLVQCAEVAAWLSSSQLMTDRASGRFASEQEWRTIAAKRRDSCAPNTLFITDLVTALSQTHGVESIQYPPPSLERLIQSLFLSGSASLPAYHAKLATLTYGLVDGGFMNAGAAATGLVTFLHVSVPSAYSWLLQLFCDDAYGMQSTQSMQTANQSLKQAAGFVPVVDGATLPFRAIQVFLDKGRPDVALTLLRQRSDATNISEDEASTALGVRLTNGLLAEGFLELKRFLAASPLTQRASRAHRLIGELLHWASKAGTLHAVIRLPFGYVEEEQAVLQWLKVQQRSDSSTSQAGIMVVLYFLMRGRTPEAVYAYDTLCTQNQTKQPGLGGGSIVAEVEALLAAAEHALPAVQRNLLAKTLGEQHSGAAVSSFVGPNPVLSEAQLQTGLADSLLLGSIPNVLAQRRQRQQQAEALAGTESMDLGVGSLPLGQKAGGGDGAKQAKQQQTQPEPLLFGRSRGVDIDASKLGLGVGSKLHKIDRLL